MVDSDKVMEGRAGSGWELLRTRNFGLLFSGQVISQIGDGMNKVALLWFVYELTGSVFKMAIIGLLQTIPPLVFGPLIGVYLDRVKKKPVMVWVDFFRTGLVILIPLLYAMDALTLERLYVLVFATSIVSTVFGPALASAVPLLVPRAQLTAANALIQSTTNIGLLIGPAVSGVGIAMIGAQNVLYFDAATFLVSALCLIPIQLRESLQARPRSTDRPTILQDLLVGFRFVFVQHRTVLLLLLTATLYSFGASAFVFLLPVFATQNLDASPIEIGWMWSSLGIGMLAASVWLAWIKQGDLQKPSTVDFRCSGCRRRRGVYARYATGSRYGSRPHYRVRWQHRCVYADCLGDVARIDARPSLRPCLYHLQHRRYGFRYGRDGRIWLGGGCHRTLSEPCRYRAAVVVHRGRLGYLQFTTPGKDGCPGSHSGVRRFRCDSSPSLYYSRRFVGSPTSRLL